MRNFIAKAVPERRPISIMRVLCKNDVVQNETLLVFSK